MVWIREDAHLDTTLFTDYRWTSQGGPSFSAAKAVFPFLPRELLEPCLLSPEVMQMYMSPQLLPQGPSGKRPRDIRSARVRSIHEQAGCFLAQYHYQHELPASHLQCKGLLGVLLDSPQGLRFYSSPEVAIAQGVSTPFLIDSCDRVAMRILGNALASHHAVMVIALTLQLFPAQAPGINPVACMQASVAATMKSDDALLLRVDKGWLLCKRQQAACLFADASLRSQIHRHLVPSEPGFYEMHIRSGQGDQARSAVLLVSCHAAPDAVVKMVDIAPDLLVRPTSNQPCKVDCAEHPRLLTVHSPPRVQARHPVFFGMDLWPMLCLSPGSARPAPAASTCFQLCV